MLRKICTLLLLSTLLVALAGCAATAETPAVTVVPVDTEAIVATVSAGVEAEQAARATAAAEEAAIAAEATAAATTPTPTPEPTVEVVPVADPDGILAAGDLEGRLVELYARANPATVFLLVPLRGSGSGFVYDAAGNIVTNRHVIAGATAVEVVFANGERREGSVVGEDIDSDLAVIRVPDLPEGTEPIPLGDGESLQVGQLVAAIGNPFGEQGSMSLGIISALDRSLSSQRRLASGSSYSLPGVIQTDAPINPGNSGGPLLNLAGELVGVSSAIATFTGENSGVGFAVPVQAVRQIVPVLIAEGEYTYPFMGLGFHDEISLEEQELFGLPQTQGAYIVNVLEGGPADEAGFLAANLSTGRGGDLIVAVDGRPVGNFDDLNTYLVFHTEPGQTVDMTVLRGGEEIVLPLTLGSRP